LKLLKDQDGVNEALLIEKTSWLACGSTINGSEEDVVIGRSSLLIVTCEKVTKTLKFQSFKEFRLKTASNYLLLTDVTQDLMLVILLNSNVLENGRVKEIEEVGKQVTTQIRKLWDE